jgi:hypothetical protein
MIFPSNVNSRFNCPVAEARHDPSRWSVARQIELLCHSTPNADRIR